MDVIKGLPNEVVETNILSRLSPGDLVYIRPTSKAVRSTVNVILRDKVVAGADYLARNFSLSQPFRELQEIKAPLIPLLYRYLKINDDDFENEYDLRNKINSVLISVRSFYIGDEDGSFSNNYDEIFEALQYWKDGKL